MAAKPTKFFRVAVEGKTFGDGRTIERKWLTDIAETYNPATYTARMNCEHLRGYSPDRPFNSYGNVTAVKAEEIEIEIAGKKEKRMALFAAIDPLPQLRELTSKGQKIFTSIEVNPNFAGTGKAYLAGIAATDSPASLGTEVLAFAAMASNNLYSAADETTIELEGDAAAADQSGGLIAAFKAGLLAAFGSPATNVPPAPAPATPVTPPANDNPALAALTGQLAGIVTALAALPATLEKMSSESAAATAKVAADLAALTAKLDGTPANTPRQPVSGNGNLTRTDC